MKSSIFTAIIAGALVASTGCGPKKVSMDTTAAQPAAQGRAELSKDDNGNTVVTLKAKHLARPENLSPAKQVYVVWIQPRGEQPMNQGVIKPGDNLEAEFKSRTPYKNFDIFVTAEDSPTATSPTGTEVMRQHLQEQ
jgi:hypothetical protein